MGSFEGPFVVITQESLEKIKPLFDNMEHMKALELKKAKLMDEMTHAIVHHKMVVKEPKEEDAQNAAMLEFTPKALSVLRRCFRAVVDKAWADKDIAPDSAILRSTNRSRLERQSELKIDGDKFTCLLPLRRGNIAVTFSVAVAKALIEYMARRIFYGESDSLFTPFDRKPSPNTWELAPMTIILDNVTTIEEPG